MNTQLKKGRRYEYNIVYQIAWCTKDRQPVFADFKAKVQMTDILYEKIEEKNMEMLRISVGDDYVYICIAADPQTAPVDIVKMIKGGSAKRIQAKHPDTCDVFKDNHIWDDRYLIVTGNQDITETVFDYVQRQKKG